MQGRKTIMKKLLALIILTVGLFVSVASSSDVTDENLSYEEAISMHDYGIEFEEGFRAHVVNTKKLNVRSKPNDEDSKIIGWLEAGEEVQVSRVYQGDTVDWYLISVFEGSPLDLYGWVSGKYLKLHLMMSFLVSSTENLLRKNLVSVWSENSFKAQQLYQGNDIKIAGEIDDCTTYEDVTVIVFSYAGVCINFRISNNDPMLSKINKFRYSLLRHVPRYLRFLTRDTLREYATIQGHISKVGADKWNAYTLTNCKIISVNIVSGSQHGILTY